MRDVWSFPAIALWEKNFGKHPTQKPLNLLVRLLLMESNIDSIICVPFSGSSTTSIAQTFCKGGLQGLKKRMSL
ncbi:DNA modification methyltransferase [Helicobacter muridarum]|uniref:site-specific DNA-methyltransferase (adenine-specific) n=1 Tax=Helicobacter muridarum TaxID=216 RepID=A0A377PTV2_9HELI|nr:DNA modification methyltransferase [Helicobacter muridarum]